MLYTCNPTSKKAGMNFIFECNATHSSFTFNMIKNKAIQDIQSPWTTHSFVNDLVAC